MQGGVPIPGFTGPNPMLLLGTCMGCHSNDGTDTIKIFGTIGNIPQVWNRGTTTDPGTSDSISGTDMNLAGGNFRYVVTGPAHAKGHNVDLLGVIPDAPLVNTPPGYLSSEDPSTVDYNDGERLTCAGSNGCHGNRNVDRSGFTDGAVASLQSLEGAHHDDDTTIDGSTVGKSYRFLKGILGREDDNWQQSAAAGDHNEYQGATVQNVTTTISYLCGNCHGNFHAASGILSSGAWIRHPTDTDVISQGGEYANYNTDNTYSIEAPVAYNGTIPVAVRSTVASGDSIVMCLSCHRAHATPNDDILRWDYATIQAGGGGAVDTGCFRCHTAKDGTP
jgi:cytochrome c553